MPIPNVELFVFQTRAVRTHQGKRKKTHCTVDTGVNIRSTRLSHLRRPLINPRPALGRDVSIHGQHLVARSAEVLTALQLSSRLFPRDSVTMQTLENWTHTEDKKSPETNVGQEQSCTRHPPYPLSSFIRRTYNITNYRQNICNLGSQ